MGTVDWKACAVRVSGLIDRVDLEPAVLAHLDGLPAGQTVGIACSGGADSVLLTLVLITRYTPRLNWQILHFDHGVRGEDSAADARFAAAMASGLDLPFRHESGRLHRHPAEGEMRVARMAFLHRCLAEAGAVDLAFGHQADDVVESMLIRLARGSGTSGLAAPRPIQAVAGGMRHLRPLLRLSRERIQQVLRQANVCWCEDASNRERTHLRNRLRRDVIPAWAEAETRNLTAGILLARSRLEDEDEALSAWLTDLLPGEKYDSPEIRLEALNGYPRALWRRAIESWARRRPGLARIGRAWIESLVQFAMEGASTRVAAGDAGRVEVDGSCLCYRAWTTADDRVAWPQRTLALGSTLILPNGASVTARMVRLDADSRDRVLQGAVNPDAEAWLAWPNPDVKVLQVRSWRAGDRYRPLGSPGSTKLGDQFTNRKISMERRDVSPVFCHGEDEVIWSPGLPPAHSMRVNAETNRAVQLTYCWHPATICL